MKNSTCFFLLITKLRTVFPFTYAIQGIRRTTSPATLLARRWWWVQVRKTGSPLLARFAKGDLFPLDPIVRVDIEVPNFPVDMDSWGKSACSICYRRGFLSPTSTSLLAVQTMSATKGVHRISTALIRATMLAVGRSWRGLLLKLLTPLVVERFYLLL